MFRRFINWIKGDSDSRDHSKLQQRRRISAHNAIRPAGKPTENRGAAKQVLIRNKYVREDTGTHETLTIMDDSMVDSGEEYGVDPYNSGEFDRSKNWDVRFRN